MDKKEKKPVKNKWLKIESRGLEFNIGQALEHDMTYPIAIEIDIVDVRTPSNHDGTIDLKFIGRSTGVLVINDKDKKDTVLIKSDKRSQSQLLRRQIINTCKTDIPLDDHYKKKMTQLRHFWYIIDKYLDDLELKEKAGEL